MRIIVHDQNVRQVLSYGAGGKRSGLSRPPRPREIVEHGAERFVHWESIDVAKPHDDGRDDLG